MLYKIFLDRIVLQLIDLHFFTKFSEFSKAYVGKQSIVHVCMDKNNAFTLILFD